MSEQETASNLQRTTRALQITQAQRNQAQNDVVNLTVAIDELRAVNSANVKALAEVRAELDAKNQSITRDSKLIEILRSNLNEHEAQAIQFAKHIDDLEARLAARKPKKPRTAKKKAPK